MRVLIATGAYPPEVGGPATHTVLLERELPRREISVDVVPFVRVRRLPRLFRNLWYVWLLLRSGRRADLLYALDPVSVGAPVYLAHVLLRKPYIVRISGDYAWERAQARTATNEPPHAFASREKGHTPFIYLLRIVERFVARHSQAIITPSKYLQGVVQRWGIPVEKIRVVHNPAQLSREQHTKAELRKRFGYRSKIIFCAGRLIPLKRFEGLIDILPEVRREHSGTQLVIAGDGPLREFLTERTKEAGLHTLVTILGSLPQDELAMHLRAADVFVQNSTHETFPHIVLEAMVAGTPVVATAVGGTTEIIEDKKSGLLVPSGDRAALIRGICAVLSDMAHADQLRQGAADRLHAFTIDTSISATAAIIREQ